MANIFDYLDWISPLSAARHIPSLYGGGSPAAQGIPFAPPDTFEDVQIPKGYTPAPALTPPVVGPGHTVTLSPDGLGIPIPAQPQIVGQNLPAQNPFAFAMPQDRNIPMASPPASMRFSSTRPEFIFTNPASAQQAASNYAARLGFENNQDQGYRQYLGQLNESNAATQRAGIQGQGYINQLDAAMREGEANRASAERISASQEGARQARIREAQYADQMRAWEVGTQTADMLNKDPNAKVDRKWVWLNPATARWESRFPRPTLSVPTPPTLGVPAPVLNTTLRTDPGITTPPPMPLQSNAPSRSYFLNQR